MNKKEEEELKKQAPPEDYKGGQYPYSLRHCPGYEGYTPKDLSHEVCKFCGSIKYYH